MKISCLQEVLESTKLSKVETLEKNPSEHKLPHKGRQQSPQPVRLLGAQ